MKFQELNVIRPVIKLFGSTRTALPLDPSFFQCMINRLLVGKHRHGKADRSQDYLFRLKGVLGHYERTGNQEFLVDVANYAMLECMHPSHPESHFESSDSYGRKERLD